jgi:hypothetical protein
VVVGSRFTCMGFILIKVLGAVLRGDRGILLHQHMSMVVFIRIYRVRVLFSFFGILFERFCCPFRWSQPRRCRRCISYCYSGLCCYIFIFIIIIFIVCDLFIYLFHIAFRTHVSSCVRGGIITPNPD